ncbi:hypothetical protein SMICM17S_05784 [Streptomyces microflavus]
MSRLEPDPAQRSGPRNPRSWVGAAARPGNRIRAFRRYASPAVLVALCVNVFLSPGHLAFLTNAEQGLRELVAADTGSLQNHLGGTSGDASGADAARRAAASLGALVAVAERLAALGALRADHERTDPRVLPRSARDHAIRADAEAGAGRLPSPSTGGARSCPALPAPVLRLGLYGWRAPGVRAPAWLAARRHHWALACALTALATTVRVSGLFLAAAIAVLRALGPESTGLRSVGWAGAARAAARRVQLVPARPHGRLGWPGSTTRRNAAGTWGVPPGRRGPTPTGVRHGVHTTPPCSRRKSRRWRWVWRWSHCWYASA